MNLLDSMKLDQDPLDDPIVVRAIKKLSEDLDIDLENAKMIFESELDDYINDEGSSVGFTKYISDAFETTKEADEDVDDDGKWVDPMGIEHDDNESGLESYV